MKCAPFGASTTPSVISRLMRSVWTGPFAASSSVGTICSTLMNALRRGHAEQVVEVGVDVEVLAVAARVAAVHVDERDVEVERRRGDQLLAVVVGRDAPCGSRAGGRRRPSRGPTRVGQERHPPRRGLQPEQEHALVELERLTAPAWRAVRKCGSSAIESSEQNA